MGSSCGRRTHLADYRAKVQIYNTTPVGYRWHHLCGDADVIIDGAVRGMARGDVKFISVM